MKKESKNLGISKACPECRKTIIKSANILGNGSLSLKCPHCKNLIKVEIGQKTSITLTKVLLTFLIAIGIFQIFTLTGLKDSFTAMIQNYDIETR